MHRAFGVQFRVEADVERERFEGRVEHMVSGQSSRFHSLNELLAFIVGVLTKGRIKPVVEP